ncbi:MAG: FliO/MopB family protein [Chloroflexota bacterium]
MGNEFGPLFDLAWKLLLVIGLAVLSTRALKWLSNPSVAPDSLLKILARLPIGPQQTLVLAAVGKKRILIGQTAQQLTLLAELAEDDLPAEAESSSGVPRASGPKMLLDVLAFTGRRPSGVGSPDDLSGGPAVLAPEEPFRTRFQRALAAVARGETPKGSRG